MIMISYPIMVTPEVEVSDIKAVYIDKFRVYNDKVKRCSVSKEDSMSKLVKQVYILASVGWVELAIWILITVIKP